MSEAGLSSALSTPTSGGVSGKHAQQPVISACGLGIQFGGLKVVDGVDLSIASGERRLLLGPNGAGKTTLFNLIAGDLRATAGTIKLFGEDVTAEPTTSRARLGLARTYQIITLFREATLLRNVQLALTAGTRRRWNPWRSFDDASLASRAHHVLAQVELDTKAHAVVANCSYGEMRRLEIALALAQSPRILLLDEPLAGLSGPERKRVGELLHALPRELTIVMIEHDMDVALAYAGTVTVLQGGRVVVDGEKQAVLDDPRTQEIYLGH
ncbi:ABC transporter ATP-binding protein [Burkholderia sp. Bp8998]|uniref:ABC transporter ATP-binding protein n=1 Tax=Burkholderia sp. Bp8998 TaxID=2184557 RepID=UPI000F5A3CE6|nr:ABC transporter ATP-binding protein [Burkholderia sp. Bp8998]RQS21361.1 ABC transporter ATP-binding protein [Burkholderia sp. Bp8998]